MTGQPAVETPFIQRVLMRAVTLSGSQIPEDVHNLSAMAMDKTRHAKQVRVALAAHGLRNPDNPVVMAITLLSAITEAMAAEIAEQPLPKPTIIKAN